MNPKQLKHAFEGSGYACLAFGPGGLMLASNARGIAPLFELCGLAHAGMPLYVADKVIGKAAALLCVRSGVLAVYADVMSHFATGERSLNRVWSASADCYGDEVTAYLEKAQSHFAQALQKVRQLET